MVGDADGHGIADEFLSNDLHICRFDASVTKRKSIEL